MALPHELSDLSDFVIEKVLSDGNGEGGAGVITGTTLL